MLISALTGALLFTAGILVRLWAARTFQRQGFTDWERIGVPKVIVEDGPYRWLRHPMYLGTILMMAGAGIAALGWGGAVLAYAVVPVLRWRVVLETEALALARAGERVRANLRPAA